MKVKKLKKLGPGNETVYFLTPLEDLTRIWQDRLSLKILAIRTRIFAIN